MLATRLELVVQAKLRRDLVTLITPFPCNISLHRTEYDHVMLLAETDILIDASKNAAGLQGGGMNESFGLQFGSAPSPRVPSLGPASSKKWIQYRLGRIVMTLLKYRPPSYKGSRSQSQPRPGRVRVGFYHVRGQETVSRHNQTPTRQG